MRIVKWQTAAAAVLVAAAVALTSAQAPADVTLVVPGRTNATPWIAADGRFVAVVWGATLDGRADVFVATSDDAGATFGAPVRVNALAGDARVSGEIPPRVALHRAAGAVRPEVVVAWNARGQGTGIKLARSRDGGRTFGAALVLQTPGAAGERGWHALTVDATGTAHVIWLDHRGLAEARTSDAAARAKPAAAPATTPPATAAQPQHGSGDHDGVAMAQKSRLYYARVGETATVESALVAGVCYCCKTALAPTSRGVVAAWRHVYAGNMRDIAFTTIGAAPTEQPTRVSADGWAINGCPDDGPAMAVGAGDRVHIVWPTVIPGAEPIGAVFYSAMTDGAKFGPRQRVPTLGAPKPSHPQVIDVNGRIVVAWDESREGLRRAGYVTGERGADGAVRFGTPQHLVSGDAPTSYPVLAVAGPDVVVALTAGPPAASVIRVVRLAAAPGATRVNPARAQ